MSTSYAVLLGIVIGILYRNWLIRYRRRRYKTSISMWYIIQQVVYVIIVVIGLLGGVLGFFME